MCFTPLASITTAIVEFTISIYIFHRIKNKKFYPLGFFVFLLGLYQFTEFMLCKTNDPVIWARIGFATYTFMPILLYHFFVNASGNRINRWFYIFPVFFSSLALFYPNFISYTSCNYLHVTVKSLIYNESLILMLLYLVYYLSLPIYGVYKFSKRMEEKSSRTLLKIGVFLAPFTILIALLYYFWSSFKEFNMFFNWINTTVIIFISVLILVLISSLLYKNSKKLFYETDSLVLVTSGITIIMLYYLVPNLTYNYSSIFCQFSLLYSIAAVLLINRLDE